MPKLNPHQEKWLADLSKRFDDLTFRIDGKNPDTAAACHTDFEIRRLLPEEAWECFEEVREAIGARVVTLHGFGSVNTMIVGVLLSLPRPTVKSIRSQLFSEVYFTNRHQKTQAPVDGNIPTAFSGLKPISIYEVLVRAFTVNFSDSLTELLSFFPEDPETLA